MQKVSRLHGIFFFDKQRNRAYIRKEFFIINAKDLISEQKVAKIKVNKR